MPKLCFTLAAASLMLFAPPLFAADAPVSSGDALFREGDRITLEKAADFLSQTTALNMEEMADSHLEAMVCTPHALPRKLFFQALCDCATDPQTKISDLEILALNEETDRAGEGGEETGLTLKDVNQDVASPGYLLRNPAADASQASIPSRSPEALAAGSLDAGWTHRILRTGSVSF